MNQADDDVGHHLRRPGFDIGPIRLIRLIGLGGILPEPAYKHGLPAILFPEPVIAGPQIIVIICQQLFQTGPSHVRQFDFHLLRRAGGHASLDDVLLAGPGRLDHLIAGPALPADEAITEVDCGVIDDLSLPIGKQIPVAAMWWDETFCHISTFAVSPSHQPVQIHPRQHPHQLPHQTVTGGTVARHQHIRHDLDLAVFDGGGDRMTL